MAEKSYVNFVETATTGRGVTKAWFVFPKMAAVPIGTVKWHAPWRRYCFFPEVGSLYDATCLGEIGQFCDQQTTDRKEERRLERLAPVERELQDNAAWQERMLDFISP